MKTWRSYPFTLWFLGLSLLLFCVFPQAGFAQQTDLAAGLSFGLSSQPEEKDFESTSQTLDVNFNVASFRFGYNSAQSYLSTNLYDHSWPIKLKSESYYGAYVFGGDTGSYMYGLAGVAYQVNMLSLKNGINDQRTQDFALVAGGGYLLDLDSLLLGLQWMMISGQSEFSDLKVATGSSQLQLATIIPF